MTRNSKASLLQYKLGDRFRQNIDKRDAFEGKTLARTCDVDSWKLKKPLALQERVTYYRREGILWLEFVLQWENLALASFKLAHCHKKHSVLWSTDWWMSVENVERYKSHILDFVIGYTCKGAPFAIKCCAQHENRNSWNKPLTEATVLMLNVCTN